MSPTYELEYDDITPTEEQDAILEVFASGKDLAVAALAGTGKTSTLRMAGEVARRRQGVYLAFNKAIADEATASFPVRVQARTAHSFAFRAVGTNYQHRLNGHRMPPWDVAKRLGIQPLTLPERVLSPTKLASLTREMVNRYCYTSDFLPSEEHVPFVRGLERRVSPETGEVIAEDQHGVLAEYLLPYAQEYWNDIRDLGGSFRFEHDHYLKIWALTHPQLPGDFVLADESQDLNGVLVGLITDQEHMQKVIVGDSNQQIYAWRGSVNAMQMFDVAVTLPLTQSWRFGPEIAAAANVFLAQLGSDLELRGNPDKTSAITSTIPDAVLCRTNAGGLEMVMGALQQGRKVHFAGNRPKEMLSFFTAVQQMQQGRITTHQDLQAFARWQEVVDYVKTTNDPEFSMLVRLVERYGVDKLLTALSALVPQGRADLTISTAHSAKGLEWPNVRLAGDFGNEPEEGGALRSITPAETRLRYVAVTRAMDVLDPGPLAKELGADDEGEDEWEQTK